MLPETNSKRNGAIRRLNKPRPVILLSIFFVASVLSISPARATVTTTGPWTENYPGKCLLGATPTDSHSPYNIGLGTSGYGGSYSSSNCDGTSSLGVYALANNLGSSANAQASVTFTAPSFTVPSNAQQYSLLSITGSLFVLGWFGCVGSGLAYYKSEATIDTHIYLEDSSNALVDTLRIPTSSYPNNGDALCTPTNLSNGVVVISDSGVLPLSQNLDGFTNGLSSQKMLTPGASYHLVLRVDVSASALVDGLGGSEARTCTTLTNLATGPVVPSLFGGGGPGPNKDVCHSPNGKPIPYSPTFPTTGSNCPTGSGTDGGGNCYFIQWKATTYTLTNYSPADPSYLVSVSPNSANFNSGPTPLSQNFTITLTGEGGFGTGTGCLWVGAHSVTGETAWWLWVKGQPGTWVLLCTTFSNANGASISFVITLQPQICAQYDDTVNIMANFTSTTKVAPISVHVSNTCAFGMNVATQSLALAPGGSPSTTLSISNIPGLSQPFTVVVFTGYLNYSSTEPDGTPGAVTCFAGSGTSTLPLSPWISFTNSTSPSGYSNPLTPTLPAGGSVSETLVTKLQSNTAPNMYFAGAVTLGFYTDTTQNEECSPATLTCVVITAKVNYVLGQGVLVTVTYPQLTISFSPNNLVINQGSSASTTVTVTSANGYGGSVVLWMNQPPSGWTTSFISLTSGDSCYGVLSQTCKIQVPAGSSSWLSVTTSASSTATTTTASINVYGNFPTQSSVLTETVVAPPSGGGGGGGCCPHPNNPGHNSVGTMSASAPTANMQPTSSSSQSKTSGSVKISLQSSKTGIGTQLGTTS